MRTDRNLGRIVAGRYRMRRVLGTGAHGRVYLAEDLGRGGGHVALKLIEGLVGPASEGSADVVLRHFRHPRWAAVLDQGRVGGDTWFQAVHYVRGTSLDHLTEAQPVELVWRLLEDGARVLGALHRMGLIHYDVTPGNVMLSDDGGDPHFVLTDGGLANLGPVQGVARGSPQYMAPEVTEDAGHDHRSDLYALGLVAFRLATGRDPVEGSAGDVLGTRRREDAPRASSLRPELPEALDQLIADLLERDPNNRPHDALALLTRIDAALERSVPAFLHEEGIAAAEGGSLVGRADYRERFRASFEVLQARVSAGGGRLARARAPVLKDPVHILRSEPGGGATRLAESCLAEAREAGIPAVLMSGRETTGDRRGPLRHLVDGLAGLALGPDDPYTEIRLDLGARKDLGLEERAHALTRAVEQFVRGVETTAERTPFLLVVEDFPDLPQRAQEAIRVLSRHLLARREGGGSTTTPAVLLLVDIGADKPDSMLVADAPEPERAVSTLAALHTDEVALLCAERFPGLEPTQADLDRIATASDSLPGTLIGLLAEGCRRGDLRHESGRWNWNVDALDAYDVRRGLGPVHADALRSADDCLLRLLGYLSLVDAPIEDTIVRHLWAKHCITPLPATPLVRSVARGEDTHFTTSNLAIKKAVLAELDDDLRNDLTQELLEALDKQDSPDTALDRARLMAQAGDPASAIYLLAARWTELSTQVRAAVQRLLSEALEQRPDLLQDPDIRSKASQLLESGPYAVRVATLISQAVNEDTATDRHSAVRVCETLWAARGYQEALEALEAVGLPPPDHPMERAAHLAWRGQLLFWLHREDDARTAIRDLASALRSARAERASNPSLLTQYLLLLSQSEFLRGNTRGALRPLAMARKTARAAESPLLRARVFNSLGIVHQQLGDRDGSRQHLGRALRLRRLFGDAEGVISTTLNLGRVHVFDGNLVEGASLFQAAASSAQRYAHHGALAMALRFLARTYDQRLNTRLAMTTLMRVVHLARRVTNNVELMLAAWELAPLAAATGEHALCHEMLLESVRFARLRTTGYARATHHLVSAITNIHLGCSQRANVSLVRARREADGLFVENSHLLAILEQASSQSPLPKPSADRPIPGSGLRDLYRAVIWSGRMRRSPTVARAQKCPPAEMVTSTAGALAGRERRLIVEVLLQATPFVESLEAREALARVERHLAHTGEQYLRGRALALRSFCENDASGTVMAQRFSRAVDLTDVAHSGSRTGWPLPDEHRSAHAAHSANLGLSHPGHEMRTSDQHALAHRMLVHHGLTAAPDGRVSSALRRVLAATGRMNAGAGLDSLLEGMTQDTIEITGAERACLVLVDANAALEMRIATSATAENADVGVEDLSQTVIQRVIDSRTPLLLHDVFDDEELMGRPSITSLSLRSILCVPMLRSETLYGVLYADSASAAGSFDSVDQEVLSLFAEQAASALETHRLVADVQNSMAELKAMQERLVKGERLRTMGELSSGVAHEFNNLLTSILARVQLISLNNVGNEFRQDLDLIEKACLDAAAVVRRLQSFTRKQRQEHFERVDLAEICSDAVEFLRPLWSTRRRHGRPDIHVRLRTGPGLAVQGNATELREVVTNLLKNGLDALADGGEIQISAHAEDGLVQLRIEDDGPGIPEDIQSKIFDPFFTTKGERGTGLGLCLSQQIVERHGGEMVLTSRLGEGARFTIEMPGADAAEDAASRREQDLNSLKPSLRVLVVDDDDNVRKPLCRFLEKSGYEVTSAQDGAEGEEQARERSPDVVITDVSMPGMDGLELCRRLRRDMPDTPVILMSGWTSGVDPARARRAGATALLAKPFALQQVTELLGTIAKAAHRDDDARPKAVGS